ncbi:MAG: hypothetical protein ACT4PZ_16335 [Panacagrimonas sp.]
MKLAVAVLLAIATFDLHAAGTAPEAGITIMGDQDAAVGLFLAPWKDERRGDVDRAPALLDPAAAPTDAQGFARSATYYMTGRAYRVERLQRNR